MNKNTQCITLLYDTSSASSRKISSNYRCTLKAENRAAINILNWPPVFFRQDHFLPFSGAGFPGIAVRQHHATILPQDQIGQVQSISVNPDTAVTEGEKRVRRREKIVTMDGRQTDSDEGKVPGEKGKKKKAWEDVW